LNQVFSDILPAPGRPLRLDGDERHYLGRVLRARAGEKVRVADGRGGAAVAVLRAFEGDDAVLEFESAAADPRDPWQLRLALCAPKGDALEEALEAAVQMGVGHLTLLKSERTLANFDGAALKADRLHRKLREAARQCEISRLPELDGPLPLAGHLAAVQGPRFIASERGGLDLGAATAGLPAEATLNLLIGPEGGFSQAELAAADKTGWTAVTLGPRALRVPVAVAALCAGLQTLQKRRAS
jgi:16S rRNA (uracil1498-N3)-methyltransferase